jgi:NitT/TauT family transport system permease protein/taurine transport system permease protein
MTSLVLPVPPSRRLFAGRWGKVLRGASGVLLLLAAWQVSVPLVGLSAYFYPAPSDVVASFADLMRKGILPVYFADSMVRYGAGLLAGALLGVAMGVLIGLHRTVAITLSPCSSSCSRSSRSRGYRSSSCGSATASRPSCWRSSTSFSSRSCTTRCSGCARRRRSWSMHCARWVHRGCRCCATRSCRARCRASSPACASAPGFAFRGLVFAEIVAAKTGIGYLIFEGTQTQQTARTIVGMIVMGLTWLAIDLCFLRPVERATIQRWGLTVDAEQRT